MTTVTAESIPHGSYSLRVFRGDADPDTAPIDAVLVLENHGDGVGLLGLAKGSLDNDINISLGLKAMELGFKVLVFYVAKGQKVSRWAKFTHSSQKHDYYRVDLAEAYKELTSG